MKKSEVLAKRISTILNRLNQGLRLDINELAGEFDVSLRTVQRDFNERLSFLHWEEEGSRFYKLDRQKSGFLTHEDIQCFGRFVGVSDLFPENDRTFYQESLLQSVQIKGVQLEKIDGREKEFSLIQQAIGEHQQISFSYYKHSTQQNKFYQIAPYSLTNKNGVWYVIGTDHDKQKTFCFTQISKLTLTGESFQPNEKLLKEIQSNDSLSHGNQVGEVLVKVSAYAAPYFLRRNLLPNQKLVHKTENGELILSCANINELDIVPLVQYWIPHLTIISPAEMQTRMVERLQQYLANLN
ncbi:helix-turn-helix transcriptional regulator [Caviibacterium pharyngocola]|uniref:Transcriptional regulator n=1 Tax=Caviibacterium pharyngocola TaxID=28159 RepID=A0A2M8RWS9_9PAST|nr:WYL domain-containing protein [Caviibacterium pharyngocola]PJG83346.1 transcriptional regulator [Caviibacterium pharyngocola]